MKLKKKLTVWAVFLITTVISAQQNQNQNINLASGIGSAADELQGIFTALKTFLFILAAIVALYGAFNVYSKYQAQDQDAAKSAAKFGFAFVFIMAAAFIIEAVFI